jgi:hypothetical protein
MERLPDFIRARLRQLAQSKPRWRKSTKLYCQTTQRGTRAEGEYSIELFKPDGEGASLEEILGGRHDNLTVALAIYRGRVAQLPGQLVMLCDRARILARRDRPETMPQALAGAITCDLRHSRGYSHIATADRSDTGQLDDPTNVAAIFRTIYPPPIAGLGC